jgi:hypothetical protein
VSTLVASAEQVPTETATVVPVQANPTSDDLGRSATSLARGETAIHIQQVYPLAQVQDAFDQFGRGTLGKLVIAID